MKSIMGKGFWALNSSYIGIGRDTSDPYSKPKPEVKIPYRYGMRSAENSSSVASMANRVAKDYIVTDPQGVEQKIHNLARFCREHDLEAAYMHQVMAGRLKHHRGWKCRRVEDKEKEQDGTDIRE